MKTTLKNYKETIINKDFYKLGYTADTIENIENFLDSDKIAQVKKLNDLYSFKKMMSKQLVYTLKNDNIQTFEPFESGNRYYITQKKGYKILVHEYCENNKAIKIIID